MADNCLNLDNSMYQRNKMIQELAIFKQRRKFSFEAWNERGLNPSADSICKTLESTFNRIASSLIEGVKDNTSKEGLLNILNEAIATLDRFEYDTEEREFIVALFVELSVIIGIEFKPQVSTWLYGEDIFEYSESVDKVIDKIIHTCDGCENLLQILINQKGSASPATWMIVQCNSCKAFQLMRIDEKCKRITFDNCQYVEGFTEGERTMDEMNLRLNELKTFKKN